MCYSYTWNNLVKTQNNEHNEHNNKQFSDVLLFYQLNSSEDTKQQTLKWCVIVLPVTLLWKHNSTNTLVLCYSLPVTL